MIFWCYFMPKPKKDEPKLKMNINIEPENTDEQNTNSTDLESLSKRELVKIAKKMAIKGYGALLKDELIQQIKIVEEKERLDQIIDSEKIHALTKNELVEIAKSMSIKNISKMTKDNLIKNIKEKRTNMENNEDVEETGFTIESQEIDNNNESEELTDTISSSLYTKEYLTSLNMQEVIAIAKKISIKSYYKYNKTRLINKIVEEVKKQETEEVLPQETNALVNKKEIFIETQLEQPLGINEKFELKIDLDIEKNDAEKSLVVAKSKKLVKIKPLEPPKIKEDKKEDFTQLSIEEEIEKLNQKESLENIDKLKQDEKSEVDVEDKAELEIEKPEVAVEDKAELKIEKSEVAVEDKVEIKIEKSEAVVEDKAELLLQAKIDLEAENKLKQINDVLYKPSKFAFGTPNEDFLFEDEKDIKLAKLPISINKVVLLPVDPTKVFVYWELTDEILEKIKIEKITEFTLKVNNVTSIIYDGSNEINSSIKIVSTAENNCYVNLQDGDKNLCVELCFLENNSLTVISRSNTIYVPRNRASQLVLDTFVVVNLPEYQTKIQEIKNQPKIKRLNIQRDLTSNKNYYDLNDPKIAENYNLRKMVNKLPVFQTFSEIPAPFHKDFKIEGNNNIEENQTISFNDLSLPKKHTDFSIPEFTENKTFEALNTINIIESEPELIQKDFSFESNDVSHSDYNDKEIEKYEEKRLQDKYYFKETQFTPENDNEEFIKNFYYKIPTDSQQVHYEWIENGIPYRKIIYWISDTIPTIHEKIYKISYGPSWVREFIGGSERIKYLGASERFLGSSDQFLGGSEFAMTYIGGSESFVGSSDLVGMGSSSNHIKTTITTRNYNIKKLFE